MKDRKDDVGRASKDAEENGKKPYHPPEILYREPLEVMAALCAPAPPAKGNLGTCPTAQKS